MKFYLRVVKIFLLTLISFNCFAQKEGNIWYFGDKAGIDFNGSAPLPLNNSKMVTDEGCASIADRNTGQLLFYTDGVTVWGKDHSEMPNGIGLQGHESSSQSALIVPQPGSDFLYYIFTTNAQAGINVGENKFGGLSYSIVDMSLRNGLGDVIAAKKNQDLVTFTSEKLTAALHSNGIDIWIITHQYNSNAFYAYLLNGNGVSDPVISNSGTVHVSNESNNNAIGVMKASPNGSRLALAVDGDPGFIEIFDFNNFTGGVSNPITDRFVSNPYGIAFSPDNSRLYISSENQAYIFQYNLQTPTSKALIDSKTLIGTGSNGDLQIGPDGKIYIATRYSYFLGVIENPNALGLACNYNSNGFYLNQGVSRFGLPNLFLSFLSPRQYKASLSYNNGCLGNSKLIFADTVFLGSMSFVWNFADPTSGINNVSTLENASHTFNNPGRYNVRLIIKTLNNEDTLYKEIFIPECTCMKPIAQITSTSRFLCEKEEQRVTLTANKINNATYEWFRNGIPLKEGALNDSTYSATLFGSYTVMVSFNGCESISTELVIDNICKPTFFIPNAFTPNNDHLNDSLAVFYSYVRDFEVLIFNPWGEVIYKAHEIAMGSNTENKGHLIWDGKYKGTEIAIDEYPYIIKYNSMLPGDTENPRTEKGTFTIIR